MIRKQFSLDINDELIVDNFAGGGGASTGIEMALGRCVDIAVNHDKEALAMHQANHPQTLHLCEDVFHVDPVKVTGGRPVGLLWLSPDCKHFSKAKGGKPREKKIRGLAWVGMNWVTKLRGKVRVLILENVEEFQTWGPVLADGTPNPKTKGVTFRSFVGALRRRGATAVEGRELRACNYGAPTIRKRFFLIARFDGRPIVWPEPTHGDPVSPEVNSRKLKPWRTAAECIDWNLPCPSIFERDRPLADATCRRIAKGIMRYVVNCAEPFIVPLTHHDKSDRVTTMGQPIPTVTGANRGEMALVAPVLTEHANATNPRSWSATEPLRTQCAQVKGGHFALASAFLAKHYGGVVGSKMTDPVATITATDHNSLVTGCLVPRYGEREGQSPRALDVKAPMPTVVPTGNGGSLVAAHLTKFRTGSTGSGLDEPMHTITAGPKENPAGAPHAMGMIAAHLTKMRGDPESHAPGQSPDNPLHTVSAQGNHFAEVRAFLIKYYGNEKEGVELKEPMHTVTARDRFGLVTVHGEEYAIMDIGLRMLAPRELFRAQGFPSDYIIGDDPAQGLTLTKSAQVRMCGNSVCPPLAAALVRANVPEMAAWYQGERKSA